MFLNYVGMEFCRNGHDCKFHAIPVVLPRCLEHHVGDN